MGKRRHKDHVLLRRSGELWAVVLGRYVPSWGTHVVAHTVIGRTPGGAMRMLSDIVRHEGAHDRGHCLTVH